jgi:hypothetical protein
MTAGVVALSACSSEEAVDVSSGAFAERIDAEGMKKLEEQLAVLEKPTDGKTLEGAEAAAALDALAAEMPGEKDYADLGLVGTPAEVLARAQREVIQLEFEHKDTPKRTVTIAFFKWPGASVGEAAAVTLIQPSTAPAFSYAERVRGAEVELFRLEGNASTRVFKESASKEPSMIGPLALQGFAIDTNVGIRGGEMSRAARDRWCTACGITIRGAYVLGAIASRIAGGPAAGWLCRSLGFSAGAAAIETGPGAVIVGTGTFAACMATINWIGTAVAGATLLGTWPTTEKTHSTCNAISNSINQGDVCITGGPKECSPEEFAARKNDPVAKCTQYGMCARANKCSLENAAICAATCSQEGGGFGSNRTDAQKQERDRCIELCMEITTRTCQQAAPLTERAQMVPECRSYLSR